MEQTLKFVCETHFLENSSVSLKKNRDQGIIYPVSAPQDNFLDDDEFIIFQSDFISGIAVLSKNKRKASKKNNF